MNGQNNLCITKHYPLLSGCSSHWQPLVKLEESLKQSLNWRVTINKRCYNIHPVKNHYISDFKKHLKVDRMQKTQINNFLKN
jgi:hypothetical protein